MRFVLCLALTLASPALADDPFDGAMIAALSGDWTQDDVPDAAFLVRKERGTSDLVIMTGDSVDGLVPNSIAAEAVFAGPMAGQTPSLLARSDTSFIISSEQIGIGRSPWTRQVTIAYRDGAFVVAGFTHQFYDRIDPSRQGICDVNLLSGEYEVEWGPGDEQPRKTLTGSDGPRAFPVSQLSEDTFPTPCRALYE